MDQSGIKDQSSRLDPCAGLCKSRTSCGPSSAALCPVVILRRTNYVPAGSNSAQPAATP
jgi:hypothetical protein